MLDITVALRLEGSGGLAPTLHTSSCTARMRYSRAREARASRIGAVPGAEHGRCRACRSRGCAIRARTQVEVRGMRITSTRQIARRSQYCNHHPHTPDASCIRFRHPGAMPSHDQRTAAIIFLRGLPAHRLDRDQDLGRVPGIPKQHASLLRRVHGVISQAYRMPAELEPAGTRGSIQPTDTIVGWALNVACE